MDLNSNKSYRNPTSRRNFIKWILSIFFFSISFIAIFHRKNRAKKIIKVSFSNLANGITIISSEWAIYKGNDEIFALNLHCKHLGCIVNWIPDRKIFLCPCHKSKYDLKGNVLRGPAKEPLTRKKILMKGKKYLLYI